ncbi:MAG: hypothetical protein NZ733_03290 [Aigarchaeota archaeon]|nr:hypothetical protein [Aigarchaeota archaeon]MCX8203540.1 hypothetical protein [Nitrososphaeria archaeon]MDW8043714.1 hypothetical protein [Nitrososphaerota archaeon]
MGSANVFVKATELAAALSVPVILFALLNYLSDGIGRSWVFVWLVLTLLWQGLVIALFASRRLLR